MIKAVILLTLIIVAGILIKVVSSVLTVESGGDGGIFAPSMYIGAFAGFAFARLVNLTGIIGFWSIISSDFVFWVWGLSRYVYLGFHGELPETSSCIILNSWLY